MKIKKISAALMLSINIVTCLAQSLNFTNSGTWANLGDIDIRGNQITVEALVFMTSPNTFGGNIVSKHTNPQNVNYLLRPYSFELTTYVNGNNGPTQFSLMNNPFTISQNVWHHIAGTYDGNMVKYYVDGCLVIEKPFSGNLFQNNLLTSIGNQSNCQCEPFFGNIDEVRIWNVSRTQDEILNNMLDLPNPTTQTGLVAYYKLDNNLVNNQGNISWNGTLVGNVSYTPQQANVQPFAITNLQITNIDCDNLRNGSISISTNRPNSLYSVNGVNFQTSNIFSNLGSGTIHVFIKSPEGCVIDSVVSIKNNNFYNSINKVESICQGENYFGYSNSGIYIDTVNVNIGCDSIRTIILTVLPNVTSTKTARICQGEKYEGYSSSGTYVDIFTTANGCDSTRTLMLTVLPNVTSTKTARICQGEEYEGYSSSGTYVDVFTAANGCDSTRTLMLTVLPNVTSTKTARICQGEKYEGYSSSGTYVDVFTAANGCDSTRTLMLTVLPNVTLTKTARICQGEKYEGYSSSGTYVDVFTTANGCDSSRTLMLTVLPNVTSTKTASICQGEKYEGYSSSGTYVDVFTAANGCDSTRTLTLSMRNNSEFSQSITICAGSNYNFNGRIITSEGIYLDTLSNLFGCDSIITLDIAIAQSNFLGNDTTICNASEYKLISPLDNTRWFDNQVIKTKKINNSGVYWASILDANGCEIIDSIFVQFNVNHYVPNVFSPNDDGINDCFQPFFSTEDEITNYLLSVFDRWGNNLFTTTNSNDCWDGKSKNKDCMPGVYVYFIEINTESCGRTLIKGNITLLK